MFTNLNRFGFSEMFGNCKNIALSNFFPCFQKKITNSKNVPAFKNWSRIQKRCSAFLATRKKCSLRARKIARARPKQTTQHTYESIPHRYPRPTRVQVLMLALFFNLFQKFRRCAFSGETFLSIMRRPQWLHKFQDDMPAQSLGDAHRDRVCVCIFIKVSVCAYV